MINYHVIQGKIKRLSRKAGRAYQEVDSKDKMMHTDKSDM